MTKNTEGDALRLSRKLGTSFSRDDCTRHSCDKKTKMRSTTETIPRKDTDIFWYSVAVGERTGWKRRIWTRERTNRARGMYIGCFDYGLVARCVLRNFYGWYKNKVSFLFKLWKTWATFFQNKKSRRRKKLKSFPLFFVLYGWAIFGYKTFWSMHLLQLFYYMYS